MSMPTPYEIGQKIYGNISGGIRESREHSSIDKILEEAANSKDPNAINNAMAGILRTVSPERQPAALGVLKNMESQLVARKAQQAEENLARQIEETHPGDKNRQVIANVLRANIPSSEKEKMIKAITGGHNLTSAQRESAHLDRVQRRYRNQIKDLREALKTTPYTKNDEARNEVRAEIKRLQDELNLLLNFSNMQGEEEEIEAKPKSKEKPVFNENNPAHMKRVEELEKEFGDDADKIEAVLQQEFSEG
jgi:hypothetical protein